MSLLQTGQCSRTSEGYRGEQGGISSLKESYQEGGHNAQLVENDALPIGAAWADRCTEPGMGEGLGRHFLSERGKNGLFLYLFLALGLREDTLGRSWHLIWDGRISGAKPV